MKKISNNLLPVLIFSLFPFVLFAQQEEAPEDTKLSLGFFLGAGLTDVSSQQLAYPLSMTRLDALGKKQAVNARLGVHFIFHFNKEYGLETGLAYEKYGVNTSRAFDAENDTIVGGEQTKSSFSYEYFSLPILFRKNFAVNEQMQISLSTGLYFAYLQSASYGYS
ncbi:MAG TPA: hypothetical protein ENJ45_04475, partial [Phaeodactylibacter sp.]|nr:hypothetical protein [Phaeodactylibacter sp.]